MAIQPHLGAGVLPYKNIDIDETEDQIKGGEAKLFWISATNANESSDRFLKLYNQISANVVVGTTPPTLTFLIPSGSKGIFYNFGLNGVNFANGLTVAATTLVADSDTGAPGTNEIVFNCGYF